MKFKQGRIYFMVGMVAVAAVYSCGKKKKSSSDSSSSEKLAEAYPSGLSLSIYPQTNSTSVALADDQEQSAKAKNEEAGKRLKGEGECFPPALAKESPREGSETCYEFDSEMLYLTDSTGNTYKYGTRTGKSSTAGSNEACMVSFTRGKVKQVTGMVDRTLGMVQMMICQARKSGAAGAPGAEGQTVDFKAIMDAAATAAGKDPAKMPVSKAAMTLTSGKYVTEIEMKMPAQPGGAASDTDPTEKITMTHDPSETDADGYAGTIVIRRSKDFDGTSSKERIVTIKYEREGTSVRYKLLTASLSTKISANAVVDGVLDLNVSTNASGEYLDPTTSAPFSSQNDAASGIMMMQFNMNPDTSAGDFAYWVNPGANYGEQPRGFVANVTADATTGLLSGCSSSGAYSGGSIRKSIKTSTPISPDGSYHPFACSSATGDGRDCNTAAQENNLYYFLGKRGSEDLRMYVPTTGGDTAKAATWTSQQTSSGNSGIVARQCFTQGTDGVYTLDTAKMTNAGTAGFELLGSTSASLPKAPNLGTIK